VNKLENVIWACIISAILGLMVFSFTMKSAEPKFKVYFYDWTFTYINSPDFLQACDSGVMDYEIGQVISKKILLAQDAVALRKRAAVVPMLGDLEEVEPLLDVTSEVYDEMVRG